MPDETTAVETVAKRMHDLRKRKGLNATELGKLLEEKADLGWDRFTVANLEQGRRQNVTLSELLALAMVLDVAPVHLFVSLDGDERIAVTPKATYSAASVRAWVRGERPLPGVDPRVYRTEVPAEEWQDVEAPKDVQVENEVSRHLIQGLEAALPSDLTPDDIAEYVRRHFTMMRTLQEAKGGDDG